jgi:uncharacterized protein involved in exopolysaccharide biosynthesis
MQIPIDFWNISLWLAVTSIILLITAQLISAYEGEASVLIDKQKLKNAALITGTLFLITVATRIYTIITST